MEINKWVLGTVAFVGGLFIGRNWKKITTYTTGFYKKGVKTLSIKPTKTKTTKIKATKA